MAKWAGEYINEEDPEVRAEKAEREADELREALEWYAEQVAGCRKIGDLGTPYQNALDRDGGGRARKALGKDS